MSLFKNGPAFLPELLLIVADELELKDHLNLRLVCRWFEQVLGFDAIVAILRRLAKRTIFGGADYSKHLRASEGYAHVPFVILDVKVDRALRSIMPHIYKPYFMRALEHPVPLDIEISKSKASIWFPRDASEDDTWENRKRKRDDNIDFLACREDIVLVTGDLLRNEWLCPECRGRKYVCPGCGGFITR